MDRVKTSWDLYWTRSKDTGLVEGEGVNHPLLDAFWAERLASLPATEVILDLASGRGALADRIPVPIVQLVSVDISRSALLSQRTAHHGILPVVADLQGLPFRPGSIDRVISQFGVEYGGHGSMLDAGSLVRPGGRLDLVLHCKGSKIDVESQRAIGALDALQQMGFFPAAIDMFQAGYAVLDGSGDQSAAGEKARLLARIYQQMMQFRDQHGFGIAEPTIRMLVGEVARIQQRLQFHDKGEVIGWLEIFGNELESYALRTSSMIEAALSDTEFSKIVEACQARHFRIEEANELKDATGDSVAWALSAVREP